MVIYTFFISFSVTTIVVTLNLLHKLSKLNNENISLNPWYHFTVTLLNYDYDESDED